MDDRHFDQITRALAAPDSRRRLLGALAALPVVGGLFGILDADDAEGRGRRKRRKKAHKHGKGRRRKHRKKTCKPEPTTQTCAGKCGNVTNTCKKVVDCGSCDCSPACAECFTCQGTAGSPGTCVPQAAGTPCGAAATCYSGTLHPQGVCDGSGSCQPEPPVPCAPFTQCDGNACASSCADDNDCVAGSFCNDSGQCVGDQPNGESCLHGGQCISGNCVDDVCCDSACDSACQACNLSGKKGTCSTEENGSTCGGGDVCCGGACQECCDSSQCLSPTAPVCAGGTCSACSANPAVCMLGSCCASDGSCQAGITNEACGGSGLCRVCDGQEQCLGKTCVCIPNCAGKCEGDSDGCTSTCPNPCDTGQDCLANGSCAWPCTSSDQCPQPPLCGRPICDEDTQGARYCLDANLPFGGPCATNANCDEGYYCYNLGACLPLCN